MRFYALGWFAGGTGASSQPEIPAVDPPVSNRRSVASCRFVALACGRESGTESCEFFTEVRDSACMAWRQVAVLPPAMGIKTFAQCFVYVVSPSVGFCCLLAVGFTFRTTESISIPR